MLLVLLPLDAGWTLCYVIPDSDGPMYFRMFAATLVSCDVWCAVAERA